MDSPHDGWQDGRRLRCRPDNERPSSLTAAPPPIHGGLRTHGTGHGAGTGLGTVDSQELDTASRFARRPWGGVRKVLSRVATLLTLLARCQYTLSGNGKDAADLGFRETSEPSRLKKVRSDETYCGNDTRILQKRVISYLIETVTGWKNQTLIRRNF